RIHRLVWSRKNRRTQRRGDSRRAGQAARSFDKHDALPAAPKVGIRTRSEACARIQTAECPAEGRVMQDLLRALFLPETLAQRTWSEWRASVQIDQLSYLDQQLLAALNPRLLNWLGEDPAAGIFRGIVRMAWTQNQLRVRKATELLRVLDEAGVRPAAIAGPLAWSLRAAPAIRPIPFVTLLVTRPHVQKAFAALAGRGCEPDSDLPKLEVMDWSDHISFSLETLKVRLSWRLIATAPENAAACENAYISRLQPIQFGGENGLTT